MRAHSFEVARPYRKAARHYHARPPYSADLRGELARRLGWNGQGRLLDVGCGPGVVALDLAPAFREVTGLDPEEAMLDEARKMTSREDQHRIHWLHGRAEDIAALDLGLFDAVTFGQSFHWTDKLPVAEIIYDVLEPGGRMILIHHDATASPSSSITPPWPHPKIPHAAINNVLIRWLGRGRPPSAPGREPYSALLERTRFGRPQRLLFRGRSDLVRTVDDVIDNYLSTSFAAPDLFGAHLGEFCDDLRTVLNGLTDTGFFHEWPGDTEVLVATKPAAEPA